MPNPGAKPISVLYFIGGNHVGGMETHLLHLAGGLDRDRFDPTICCLDLGSVYAGRIQTIGTRRVNLGIPRLTSITNVLRLRHFVTVLHELQPEVVHTYGYACDVVGPPLARLRPRTRIITTRRGEDKATRHQRVRSFVNRFTDVVLCVSDATLAFTARTERLRLARPMVIPNGVVIPPVAMRRPGSGGLRFGTLGTVKSIKGTDLLVDAFLMLDPSMRCELFIGGRLDRDSSWTSALVRRVEASAWRGRVHFLGYQEPPGPFYDGLDVFVLPSRSEGMSNALLEAMAAGLPCIATDVGSNRAVLHHQGRGDEGGLIVPPAAEALTAAIRTMHERPADRFTWARNARRLAEVHYSIASMVSAHERLYEDLVRAVVR